MARRDIAEWRPGAPPAFVRDKLFAPKNSTRPPAIAGVTRLWSPELNVIVGLGVHKPLDVLQEEAGGYRQVPRLGEEAVLTFDGSPLARIQLNLIADGVTDQPRTRSVASDIALVRELARKVPALQRTPLVRVLLLGPFPDPRVDWVIDGLAVKEQDWLPGGEPTQALITITLTKHNESTAERQSTKALGFGTYRWRKGDTLPAVAEELLGSDVRAQWIRDANAAITKKGWSKVEPGTKIRYPLLPQADD